MRKGRGAFFGRQDLKQEFLTARLRDDCTAFCKFEESSSSKELLSQYNIPLGAHEIICDAAWGLPKRLSTGFVRKAWSKVPCGADMSLLRESYKLMILTHPTVGVKNRLTSEAAFVFDAVVEHIQKGTENKKRDVAARSKLLANLTRETASAARPMHRSALRLMALALDDDIYEFNNEAMTRGSKLSPHTQWVMAKGLLQLLADLPQATTPNGLLSGLIDWLGNR